MVCFWSLGAIGCDDGHGVGGYDDYFSLIPQRHAVTVTSELFSFVPCVPFVSICAFLIGDVCADTWLSTGGR